MMWKAAPSLSAFLAIGILCAVVPLGAAPGDAGETAAVVIYAEGDGFSVASARGRIVEVRVEDAIGWQLVSGDTVATEQGTFVELQLVPSANVIKIAENTNFTIERRTTARGGSFALVYGKVRARVVSLAEKDEFSIRGESAVAGVRGTDFGVSVVLTEEVVPEEASAQEAEPPLAVTEVYCFDGQVEVTAAPPSGEPGEAAEPSGGALAAAAPIIVHANEFVSVTREAEPEEIKTRELPEEVRVYWDTNDFKAEPLPEPEAMRAAEAAPVRPEPAVAVTTETPQQAAEAAPAGAAGAERAEPISEEELRVLIRKATSARFEYGALSVALFAIGAVLETAGIVNAVTPGSNTFGDTGVGFIGVGGLLVAGGVFAALQSSSYNRQVRKLKSGTQGP